MADPAYSAAPPKPRGRAGGWQAERRAETRKRLLDAATRTFGEAGYVGTRVEDILAEAQVGRTSFYKQFRDRLDVASALFTQFMPQLETLYLDIARYPVVDLAHVSVWIDRIIDAYDQRRGIMRLFAEVAAIEPGFSETVAQIQTGIMRGWGDRFPGFARAVEKSEPELHARAVLVVETIDHVCALIALRQTPIDRPTTVRFAARIFLEFIESDPVSDIDT